MKSLIQGDSFQLICHDPRHINVITFQDTLNQTCRINGDGGSVTSWPYVVKDHRGHQLSLLRQLTTSKSLWQPSLSQSIGETSRANSLPNALCIPISSIQPWMVLTLFYQSKRVIQKIKNCLFAKVNGLTSHPRSKRISFSTYPTARRQGICIELSDNLHLIELWWSEQLVPACFRQSSPRPLEGAVVNRNHSAFTPQTSAFELMVPRLLLRSLKLRPIRPARL